MAAKEIQWQGKTYYKLTTNWVTKDFIRVSRAEEEKIEAEYFKKFGRISSRYSPRFGNYYYNSDSRYTDIIGQNILPEVEKIDFQNTDRHALLRIADKYKKEQEYASAIFVYKKIILKKDYEFCKYVYPKISSCFRKLEQPDKVISLVKYIIQTHGNEAVTPVLLTSVAASYCDLCEFEKAKMFASQARSLLNGEKSVFLDKVESRIDLYIIRTNHLYNNQAKKSDK